jgi:type IV secretion system protein VirB9
MPIKRCRRGTEAVCDLRDTDVGIGEQCPRDVKIIFCQLWRAASGAVGATCGGKARLGALADQAALEFCQCAEHVKDQPPLRSRRIEGFGQAATPGAILTIEFADDETIAGVAVSDSHVLHSDKRKNFLTLKPEGCLVPEPIVVLTNLPNGQLRRYTMQIETRPQVCGEQKPVITASAIPVDPPPGNLRYVSQDALGPAADVDYSVVYRYPGDEAEKRRAAARAAAERWKKERASRILQASTTFDTKDPYSGDRNLRYMWRGDPGLMPRWVWDNGYSTAFVFPGQQRVPSLYYVAPDGKESTATYSVHGDTIIATGTAREWRLRDGNTVIEVWDLAYNPVGSTPGTGTDFSGVYDLKTSE